MASFQKRGNTWQYCVSAKPKPIRKGGFRTKKEAQVAAAEVEAELQKGVVPHLKPEPISTYFDEWVKLYKKNVKNGTLEHYKYTLEAIREYFGDKPLQEIRKRDYQDFLNKFGATRAKETVDKVNVHIRACVKDAIDEGIIRVDFTRDVVVTYGVQAKKPSEKHLNFIDSEKLLKELYKRLDRGLGYYLLLLALTSGMRFSELVGLTRKDFDFKNNTININKTWGYAKRMQQGFGPTKNPQSERIIKMDTPTMEAFKKLFDTTPNNINQLVFFSPNSKYKVLCNTVANKLLKNMLTELKIDTITVHGLRHTHASISLYKKVSIYYISERLGHKNIETTMKDYAHVLKELKLEDEQEITNIFSKMVS